MHTTAAIAALAAGFVTYPSAGDRIVTLPKNAESGPRIEVTTDKGPILELVIRCRRGTAIISYSKIERLFCSPRLKCARDLQEVAAQTCG